MNARPILALVPARGGSKSIARKNLAILQGRPLIEYTLHAAHKSVGLEATWVSSEDDEILHVAQQFGARSLRRPPELATDEASAIGVVEHFLSMLPRDMVAQDPLLLYLQPTSPLRTAAHILQALEGMGTAGADSVVSVTALSKSPYKAFRLDDRGRLLSLFDERQSNMRRQDLPTCYVPNGAIYGFRVSTFRQRAGFPSNGAWPFVMDEPSSVDIDSPDDLQRAALLIGGTHA